MLRITATVQAQTTSGRVTNENAEPMSYVNVVLLSADSTYLNGVTTSDDGTFSVQVSQDDCLLKISCVGYETWFMTARQGDLGDIVMKPDSHTLREVVVKATRPTMKMTAGGIDFDVQHSLLSQAGNALDVLSELPRLSVNSSGAVSVFGKGSPLIYINGRQMKSNVELRQLTSKDIKSVEVITAPGARYSAQVSSVIRITTIKRIGDYMSFFVTARGNYFKEPAGSGGVSITYRKSGLELNIYPYYSNSFSAEKTDYTSLLRLTDHTQKTVQHGEYSSRTQSFLPAAKISYDFNQNHSIGASVSLKQQLNYDASMSSFYNVFRNEEAQGEVSQHTAYDYDSNRQNVNVYYVGTIGKWNLQADGTFVHSKVEQGQHITEESEAMDNRIVNTLSSQSSRMWAWKAVTTRELWKGELSFGVEQSSSHVNANSQNPEGYIEASDNRITGNNFASFATYGINLGHWSIGAGLRYEHVKSDYYSFGKYDPEICRNYNDFFPNAYVVWNKDNWGLQLSYSKKTRRPSYSQMRSYQQYDNRFTYESGSPDLQPAINHELEFMAMWKWINLSVDYTYVSDRMVWMYDIYKQQEASYSYWRNIEHEQSLGISLVMQPKFGFYQPQLMLAYSQQFLDAQKYGFTSSLRKPEFVASLMNKFVINRTFWVSLQGAVDSRHDSGSQEHRSFTSVNMRVFKSFLKGMLTCNLYVNDIFNGQRERWMIRTSNVEGYKNSTSYSRGVELQVSYFFNYKRSKYKGSGAGKDEQNRL